MKKSKIMSTVVIVLALVIVVAALGATLRVYWPQLSYEGSLLAVVIPIAFVIGTIIYKIFHKPPKNNSSS